MLNPEFPLLDQDDIFATRKALHAYSRILGAWLKFSRPKRKHWWHASLRPSLHGLTTGTIRAGTDFEMLLNLDHSLLQIQTSGGAQYAESLHGQPMGRLAQEAGEFLLQSGIDIRRAPERFDIDSGGSRDYCGEFAVDMGRALALVSAAMEAFRAEIREETSPVQLWKNRNFNGTFQVS